MASVAATTTPLATFGQTKFDFDTLETFAGAEVAARFRECLITGEKSSPADVKAIEGALFKWCSSHGCINYAHWFFPIRTGGGLAGSTAAMKHDTFLNPDWGAPGVPGLKPFKAEMPGGRLFCGETDGSSFPNGGLRFTHQAAAFTAWDRGSPPFIYEGTCYIPSAFVSQHGKMLDDKTPLLRATDAVNREGLRLLKNIGGYDDVRQVVNYLGWEQEFFIISRENFLKRPDLVATGRTLMGAPPTRGQSMDQHYFGRVPLAVKACLDDVHAALLKIGCPLNVYHNEVAPAQHEISPFFTISGISADLNQIAMQICCDIGTKHGLIFLFHEKPFAGLNGSGKHCNWSVGTDTGINLFSPGKTEKQSALFAVGVACVTYALNQHGTLIRTSVAHAGNDHRLGAQEAPPAIVSLYPGIGFEAKIEDIVGGGELAGYFNRGTEMEAGCVNLNAVERGVEERNRTAPFPYVGNNRFEFRAVGSTQSCGFPMAMVNCAFADGMRHLNEQLESGKPLKECVAAMFRDNRQVIFCGNGYSAEWLVEAEKRGLPNLKDTVQATTAFNTPATKAMFERMGVMSAEEVDSRQEVLFENYIASLEIEAATLVKMVRTGVEPATAADLATFAAGDQTSTRFTKRAAAYELCSTTCDALEAAIAGVPHGGSAHATAKYMADVVKPHLSTVRKACDDAEVLVKADLWPFPSYSTVLYGHHF